MSDKLVIDTYNKIVNEYENEYGNDYSDALFIDTFLNSLNGKEVLDIGCGLGNLTNYMKEKGFNLTGIDLSDEMLNFAKSKYKDITFLKMNMNDIKFDKKFDGISFLYSLFHLSKKEVVNALPKYYNLLKDDGKMLLIMQEGDGEKIVDEPLNKNLKMFVNYYSLDEIKKVLEEANFKVIYTSYKKSTAESLSTGKLVLLCEKRI